MSKIDLGLVGVFPWTSLNELYDFPDNPNYTFSGGYKVINNTCFIDLAISASGSASVTLPVIKTDGINTARIYNAYSGILPSLYQTGEGQLLTTNILNLKSNDNFIIYGYYEVG